jgi:hypothetical protein
VRPEGPITPEVLAPEARVKGELTVAPEGEGGAFVWESKQLRGGEWGVYRDGDLWATRPTEAEAVDFMKSRPTEAEIQAKVVKPYKTRWEIGQEWYAENSMEQAIVNEGGMKLDMSVAEERAMVMPNMGARTDARARNMFDPIRAMKGEDAMAPDQMFHILQDNQVIPKNWTQSDFMQAMTDRTPGSKGTFPNIESVDVMDKMDAQAEALTPAEFREGAGVPGRVRPEVPERVAPDTRAAGEPPRTMEQAEADWEKGRAQIKAMRDEPGYAGTDFEALEVENNLIRQQNIDRIQRPKPTTIGPGFGPEEPRVAPETPRADIPPKPKDTVTGETMRRETLDELEARQDVMDKGFEDQLNAFREGYGEVGFQVPMRGEGRYAILHESTRPEEGAWQTSYFDKRGPSGHHMSPTWSEAVADLQSEWRVDLSEARVKGQPNLDRAMTDMEGYDLVAEEARNRSLRGEPPLEALPTGWEIKRTETSSARGDWGAFLDGRLQRRKHTKADAEIWARERAAKPLDPDEPPMARLKRKQDEAAEAVEGMTGFEGRAERQELIDQVQRDQRAGPEALTDADLERLRKPRERGAPSPEVGEAAFPGRAEPTVTPEGEAVSFAEGREAYQERIRQVEGWEIDLERAAEKRPPTPSEKLEIPPDVRGGVEVAESPEYKAFWEKHAAEYGKLSDIVDRIELSGLERAERARAEAVRIEAERRLAEIDNRAAEIPDPGPKPVEPTVRPEGQVEIVGHEGFKRESRLADDKAKLENILTARPDQTTPAGKKQIIELGKREKALRKSIAEQEKALRAEGDIEQAGMFAEDEPPLFTREPTPEAEKPPAEETAGLYAEEPKVEPEGRPKEPLQTPLTTYETGHYRVERTAIGEYDIYLDGKKVNSFRYRTDAVDWADKQAGKLPPTEQPRLEGTEVKPPEPTTHASDYVDSIVKGASKPGSAITTEVAGYAKAYLNWKLGDQKLSAPRLAGDMARSVKGLIDQLVEADKPRPKGPGGQSTLYSNPIQPMMDWWSKRVGPKIWRFIGSTKEPYGILVKPWPEPLKWLFINRHKQPATWVERHREWQRKTEEGAQEAFKLGQDMTRKLSQDDQLLLGDLLKGKANEAELRAMRENPEWQAAIDAVKTARSKFDEYAALAAEQKLLSEENFFLNHGKYMPRLYRRYEVDYDAQLRKYGASRPTRLDQDRYKKRQDIPEEIRVLRGEILEPGYPVAKGLSAVIHDVETSKLFNFVADNKAWTVSPENMVELGKDPKKYTLMPTTTKLGRLSGQYVDKYIASELNQMTKSVGELSKLSRRLVSEWKVFKVIFNPPTHGRNMISNSMLAYLDGLGPWRVDIYGKAISQLWQQKGEHYDAAKAEGLFSTTFTKGELTPLIDSWNSTKGGLYDRFAGMAENFEKGEVAEGLGKVLPSSTRAGQRAAKIYQGEEAWFKLARYIKAVEDGATPKQAAAQAQKALFDYTEVPPFVNWARTSPVGAPFITFTYKALPQILETGITHPWRLGALVYGIYAAEEAARKHLGISEDQLEYLKRIMPDRMRGEPLGLGPKALLLPFTDKYGQLQFLDLTYILPWGDIGEQGATGIYQGSPIHAAPMRAIYEITINKSSYTGQEIYGENDSKKIVTQKISDYLYKFVMPSLSPAIPGVTEGGYGFERIWKSVWGKEDYFGRVSAPTTAIASSIIGLKTNPMNEDIELFFRQKEFEDGFDEITAAAYKVQNHQGLSEEEKNLQLDELRERMRVLREIAQDMIFGPEQKQAQPPAQQPAPPPGLPQGEPQVQPEQ